MSGDLHHRDVTGDAFYEWLLSDHPEARAERDRRRAATHQADTARAAAVRAWVGKIGAQPDAPQPLQDLAASMGPLAGQAVARAEARYAEPDDTYVARLRTQHETHIRVSGVPGSQDYRYPAHLTGPGAAAYPPPPEPDPAAPQPDADPGDAGHLPEPQAELPSPAAPAATSQTSNRGRHMNQPAPQPDMPQATWAERNAIIVAAPNPNPRPNQRQEHEQHPGKRRNQPVAVGRSGDARRSPVR